jgi:hypothetical protein
MAYSERQKDSSYSCRRGAGDKGGFEAWCRMCFTEFLSSNPGICSLCGNSELVTANDRDCELRSKMAELKQARSSKLLRRKRWEMFLESERCMPNRSVSNFDRWNAWEPGSSDEEEQIPGLVLPSKDSAFEALKTVFDQREQEDAHKDEIQKRILSRGLESEAKGLFVVALDQYEMGLEACGPSLDLLERKALCEYEVYRFETCIENCSRILKMIDLFGRGQDKRIPVTVLSARAKLFLDQPGSAKQDLEGIGVEDERVKVLVDQCNRRLAFVDSVNFYPFLNTSLDLCRNAAKGAAGIMSCLSCLRSRIGSSVVMSEICLERMVRPLIRVISVIESGSLNHIAQFLNSLIACAGRDFEIEWPFYTSAWVDAFMSVGGSEVSHLLIHIGSNSLKGRDLIVQSNGWNPFLNELEYPIFRKAIVGMKFFSLEKHQMDMVISDVSANRNEESLLILFNSCQIDPSIPERLNNTSLVDTLIDSCSRMSLGIVVRIIQGGYRMSANQIERIESALKWDNSIEVIEPVVRILALQSIFVCLRTLGELCRILHEYRPPAYSETERKPSREERLRSNICLILCKCFNETIFTEKTVEVVLECIRKDNSKCRRNGLILLAKLAQVESLVQVIRKLNGFETIRQFATSV